MHSCADGGVCFPVNAALALPSTFAATHSLLCLHVFMLLVRLREEGNDGADLAQILYEGFQDDVELRVHAEGVKVPSSPETGPDLMQDPNRDANPHTTTAPAAVTMRQRTGGSRLAPWEARV